MEHHINTVIIGGGPAGMSCAIALQSRSVSCMVTDKCTFPREKVCGGLVSDKTYRLIRDVFHAAFPAEELPESIFCDKSQTVELYYGKERLTNSQVTTPFRFVNRKDFDAFLLQTYLRSGGQLIENCTCRRIDMSRGKIALSNGDTVYFEHLVAADGALSRTREMLGYSKPRLAFCAEAHIAKPVRDKAPTVRVFFGIIKRGYAWVFPAGDRVCIGLGGAFGKKQDYRSLLQDFSAQAGFDTKDCEIRGAFVPYGRCVRQKRGYKNVLLVGDAAGFADPVYGEGLYFALLSGIKAAEAIETHLQTGKAAAETYGKAVAPIGKIIRQGSRVQRLFFSRAVMRLFKNAVINKNDFVGRYCEKQVSAYEYPYFGLWKLLADERKEKKRTPGAENRLAHRHFHPDAEKNVDKPNAV